MQALVRTQKEIGGVVFVADDTIFTTCNIALTTEVGAHTLIHTTLVVVFSSKLKLIYWSTEISIFKDFQAP